MVHRELLQLDDYQNALAQSLAQKQFRVPVSNEQEATDCLPAFGVA